MDAREASAVAQKASAPRRSVNEGCILKFERDLKILFRQNGYVGKYTMNNNLQYIHPEPGELI
jgi:hypothetical protein